PLAPILNRLVPTTTTRQLRPQHPAHVPRSKSPLSVQKTKHVVAARFSANVRDEVAQRVAPTPADAHAAAAVQMERGMIRIVTGAVDPPPNIVKRRPRVAVLDPIAAAAKPAQDHAWRCR